MLPRRTHPPRRPARNRDTGQKRQLRVSFNALRLGFFGALGAGLGWALWTSAGTLASLLTYIGVAYFLALAVEPIIGRLGRLGIKRVLGVVIVFVALIVVLLALVLLFVPLVVHQLSGIGGAVQDAIDSLNQQKWFSDIADQLGASSTLDDVSKSVITFLKQPGHLASIGGGLLSVGTGLIDGVTAVLVVTILTIYFVAGLPAITRKAFQLVPGSRAQSARPVYDEMTLSVGRYVAGQVLLATINAGLVLILLIVFHMPGIALLTALAFVGALIPIVGTIVAALVTITVSLFVSPAAVIAIVIFYVIYHPLEAYVITPRVMAKAVHVPGALVVIAVIAGSTLGGVLGALVAVPVAAAAVILVEEVIIPRQRQR